MAAKEVLIESLESRLLSIQEQVGREARGEERRKEARGAEGRSTARGT